jgi:hypothetical protein
VARKPGIRAVRIVKGDRVLHVHGALEGAEGAWLAMGQVHGLYDAPVKTTYKAGAFQEGSTHRRTQKLQRDLELGFHVRDTTTAYELNDSVLRQMFDYELDRWDTSPEPTTIEVETDLSGIRKLDVLMYEEPEFAPDLDSLKQEFGTVIFKLRASDPMWYEDIVVDEFSDSGTSASGFVTVENPTDNIMYQKWVLTPALWYVSDVQWVGPKGARAPGGANGTRLVGGINITGGNGGAVGDLDRNELMWRDANNTNIMGQLGSTTILVYPIPPYTPPTLLAVSYFGAPPGGARVELHMPRRWSRPWGMEITADDVLSVPRPFESVFAVPGQFNYHIPETATHIDVVLLGSGGGGAGGGLVNYGGTGGTWTTKTLVRGDDIPWETEVISGMVPYGGLGGNSLGGGGGGNGAAATATGTGMTPLSAGGGLGNISGFQTGFSADPQVLAFNGRNYYAGGSVVNSGGGTPGGGGSAGLPLQPGYSGAQGRVWFYAYTVVEEGS